MSNLKNSNVYVNSNKTLIHEIHEKDVNQEKLFKKIIQKNVIPQQNKANNFSSFSKQIVIKNNSNSRKPSPLIQKAINESSIMQKSFNREKNKQNDNIIQKNMSVPSELILADSTIVIKSQNLEKNLLNNGIKFFLTKVKSRNVNRNQNKLDVNKSTFKDKNSFKLHTVDNNLMQNKNNSLITRNLKLQPQSLEKTIFKKKINNITYCNKNPNKLVKCKSLIFISAVNQNIKKHIFSKEFINPDKNTQNFDTFLNKSRRDNQMNLREKNNKKRSIDSTIAPITNNHHSHTKNLSQQSFLSFNLI